MGNTLDQPEEEVLRPSSLIDSIIIPGYCPVWALLHVSCLRPVHMCVAAVGLGLGWGEAGLFASCATRVGLVVATFGFGSWDVRVVCNMLVVVLGAACYLYATTHYISSLFNQLHRFHSSS